MNTPILIVSGLYLCVALFLFLIFFTETRNGIFYKLWLAGVCLLWLPLVVTGNFSHENDKPVSHDHKHRFQNKRDYL